MNIIYTPCRYIEIENDFKGDKNVGILKIFLVNIFIFYLITIRINIILTVCILLVFTKYYYLIIIETSTIYIRQIQNTHISYNTSIRYIMYLLLVIFQDYKTHKTTRHTHYATQYYNN